MKSHSRERLVLRSVPWDLLNWSSDAGRGFLGARERTGVASSKTPSLTAKVKQVRRSCGYQRPFHLARQARPQLSLWCLQASPAASGAAALVPKIDQLLPPQTAGSLSFQGRRQVPLASGLRTSFLSPPLSASSTRSASPFPGVSRTSNREPWQGEIGARKVYFYATCWEGELAIEAGPCPPWSLRKARLPRGPPANTSCGPYRPHNPVRRVKHHGRRGPRGWVTASPRGMKDWRKATLPLPHLSENHTGRSHGAPRQRAQNFFQKSSKKRAPGWLSPQSIRPLVSGFELRVVSSSPVSGTEGN